jgi:hypothetical protein
MRDSNSRGVAPNTLSNNADQRSSGFTTVRGLRERDPVAVHERLRTEMNETRFETMPRSLPGARVGYRSCGTSGRVTGTMLARASRPVKSPGLVVNSGSRSAIAVDAIIKSTTRRPGFRPEAMTAAVTLP